MNERKYRQRGYQEGERPARESPRERPPREFRAPGMPGFRQVLRCARCGTPVTPPVAADAACGKCGTALHSCVQCVSFDPDARFQCAQPIPEPVGPKDARNACSWFEPRVTVERQTGSAGPTDARKAFDDLFK